MIEITEPEVGLDAVLVIDHEIFPTSAGGTRMAPDVTADEGGPPRARWSPTSIALWERYTDEFIASDDALVRP